MAIILFPENSRDKIDLEKNSGRTNYLESCVLVASRLGNQAVLSHLTQLSDLTKFFNWFSHTTPKESNCYVVGGMVGKSEEFVENIVFNLLDSKYTKIKMDVLGPHHRRFIMDRDKNQVHYYHQMMDANRRIVYIPLHSNII